MNKGGKITYGLKETTKGMKKSIKDNDIKPLINAFKLNGAKEKIIINNIKRNWVQFSREQVKSQRDNIPNKGIKSNE